MIGIWVIGSFAAMCLLRSAANRIMRHDDRVEARRRVDRDAVSLADEAQAWLDGRQTGTV